MQTQRYAKDVQEKKEQYEHFNILPLHAVGVKPAIMELPEVIIYALCLYCRLIYKYVIRKPSLHLIVYVSGLLILDQSSTASDSLYRLSSDIPNA